MDEQHVLKEAIILSYIPVSELPRLAPNITPTSRYIDRPVASFQINSKKPNLFVLFRPYKKVMYYDGTKWIKAPHYRAKNPKDALNKLKGLRTGTYLFMAPAQSGVLRLWKGVKQPDGSCLLKTF